ncbi:MAG: GNAT family N-acetyltransferase [Desulfuromonadales bacterium]
MIKIQIAQKPDWASFFDLAAAEGWRVPEVERQLFAGRWSDCALALKENDRFSGLVTAVAHQHSGWIGNLIVPEKLRGRGYGSRLFEAALSALQVQGMTSVWLTASESGRPIYEKSGFVAIDEIERWVSCKRAHLGPADSFLKDGGQKLVALDRAAWGEDRRALLEALDAQGKVYACGVMPLPCFSGSRSCRSSVPGTRRQTVHDPTGCCCRRFLQKPIRTSNSLSI